MNTMTGTEHSEMLAVRDRLFTALRDASAYRDLRPELVDTPTGEEYAWVLHERQIMHDVVAEERARRGLEPADPEALRRAESQAEGHCDYALKFALYCAWLAVGVEQ